MNKKKNTCDIHLPRVKSDCSKEKKKKQLASKKKKKNWQKKNWTDDSKFVLRRRQVNKVSGY